MENTWVQKRFNVENGNGTELDKNSTPAQILKTLWKEGTKIYLSVLPWEVFSDQIYKVLDSKGYFDIILKYSDKLWLNDRDIIYIINKVPEKCELEDEDSLYVREYLKEHKNNFRGKFWNKVRTYCLDSISKDGFDWWIFTCFNGVSLIDSIIDISTKNGNKYIRKTYGTMRNLYNNTPLFTVDDTKRIIWQGLWDIIIKTPEFFVCDEEIIKLLIKTPIKKEDKQEWNNEINKQGFISCSAIKNLDSESDWKDFDKKYRDAIIERLGNYDELWNYDDYETRAWDFESFVDNIDQEWLTYLVWNQNWQEFLYNCWYRGSHAEIKKLNFNKAIEESLNSVGYNRQFSSIYNIEVYNFDLNNKWFVNLYLEKFYSYLKAFTEDLDKRSVPDFENYFEKKDIKDDVLELIHYFYPELIENNIKLKNNDRYVNKVFEYFKKNFNKFSEDWTKTREVDQKLLEIIADIIEKHLSVFKKYLDKCRGSYQKNYENITRFYLELDTLIYRFKLDLDDSESLLEIWNEILNIINYVREVRGIEN